MYLVKDIWDLICSYLLTKHQYQFDRYGNCRLHYNVIYLVDSIREPLLYQKQLGSIYYQLLRYDITANNYLENNQGLNPLKLAYIYCRYDLVYIIKKFCPLMTI